MPSDGINKSNEFFKNKVKEIIIIIIISITRMLESRGVRGGAVG